MGLLKKSREQSGINMYESSKKYLKPKDGKTHVLVVTSFSNFANENFTIDEKSTQQLNPILDGLQTDGYEIVDIKFSSVGNQGFTNTATQFHTMILYR